MQTDSCLASVHIAPLKASRKSILPLEEDDADRDIIEIFPGRISLRLRDRSSSTSLASLCQFSPARSPLKFDFAIEGGRRPNKKRNAGEFQSKVDQIKKAIKLKTFFSMWINSRDRLSSS
jgi:hypothetical protein